MRFVILTVILFAVNEVWAQSVDYAHEVVNELTKGEFMGRGYVGAGEHKAAAYIASAFEAAHLLRYGRHYTQTFTTDVNTFPGKMSIWVNDIKLIPGKDYLIEPASPGITGTFNTVILKADDLIKDEIWIPLVKASANRVVVIDAHDKNTFSKDQLKKIGDITQYLLHNADNPAVGTVVITNDKLTWSTSQTVDPKPGVMIKATALNGPVTQIRFDIEQKFIKKYESQNVVGYIEGDRRDSLLVFTAHYDHLGMMGNQTIFPGANDNASGTAFLLSLVKYYATHKPKFTTVFIAFGGEEIGLVGSTYFTEQPLFPLTSIKFLVNFDMAGTGDDGIQVVNGKVYQSLFDKLTRINQDKGLLKQVKIRGEACNSDHCLFYKKGVPCFFVYTLGGIQAYHDIDDKGETLPFTEFEDYLTLMTTFINTF